MSDSYRETRACLAEFGIRPLVDDELAALGINKSRFSDLAEYCQSIELPSDEHSETWNIIKECVSMLAEHQHSFPDIPDNIKHWRAMADAAEDLLEKMQVAAIESELQISLMTQTSFPWGTVSRAISKIPYDLLQKQPNHLDKVEAASNLESQAEPKRSIDYASDAAVFAVESLAAIAIYHENLLCEAHPNKAGRRQSLDRPAFVIAKLAEHMKIYKVVPGEGGPFMKLCDHIFKAAGIPATSQGAIKKFNKDYRPEMRARGECL